MQWAYYYYCLLYCKNLKQNIIKYYFDLTHFFETVNTTSLKSNIFYFIITYQYRYVGARI